MTVIAVTSARVVDHGHDCSLLALLPEGADSQENHRAYRVAPILCFQRVRGVIDSNLRSDTGCNVWDQIQNPREFGQCGGGSMPFVVLGTNVAVEQASRIRETLQTKPPHGPLREKSAIYARQFLD